MTHDVIVIGSGPGGANAAAALVERGRSVLLLDYGDVERRYEPLIPPWSFREIRERDPQQHRYFLGDDFEGVPLGGLGIGAQLTPPRLYVASSAAERMPIDSPGFAAAESLALGGMGSAWGAGAFPFTEAELSEWPLTRDELAPHYEAVARRIGVSGAHDDLTRFFGPSEAMMPPLEIDSAAEAVLDRYSRRRAELNRRGFFMGRPRLAVCTEEHRGRGPHQYRDMEFWADTDRSVYRPRWTIAELRRHENFRYRGRRFALAFEEQEEGVTVRTQDADSGEHEVFRARALVIAAGALSTARIVLRSLQRYGERIPILCNPYTYVPAINWAMLGRETRDRRHSLAQLSAVYRPPSPGRGTVQVQFYSYRSLLAFRLLGEVPLAHREGLRIMRLLLPMVVILGISHDDRPTPQKYCSLRRATPGAPDRLEIHYELSPEERQAMEDHERAVLRLVRRLACWPIRTVRPAPGASLRYAGTFPMRPAASGLACDADCRLAATRAVYLADGSPFPYLPAKGLTFTIMANADRVGTLLARRLG